MTQLDDRIREIEQRAQRRLEALEARAHRQVGKSLDRLMGGGRSAGGPIEPPPIALRNDGELHDYRLRQTFSQLRGETLSVDSEQGATTNPTFAESLDSDYWTSRLATDPHDVAAMSALALSSPVITQNSAYAQRARATTILTSDLDLVNAFATDHAFRLDNGAAIEPPAIVIFRGLCRAARLAALALGSAQRYVLRWEGPLTSVLPALGQTILNHQGALPMEAAIALAQNTDALADLSAGAIRRARSIYSGILLNVIAHEMGHICLNHTLSAWNDPELSRRQERQADLFASSIVATTPFSDYSVIGGLLFWVLLAWVEASVLASEPQDAPPMEAASTHPIALERLADFIRDNRGQARAMGLDGPTLSRCLPEGAEKYLRAAGVTIAAQNA